jgi:tetratricopeptide (TPR) repeat protein
MKPFLKQTIAFVFALASVLACSAPASAQDSSAQDSYGASIKILDATVKNKAISGAEVVYQKTGKTSVRAQTDADVMSAATLPFGKDDENVTLMINRDGYSGLAVKCPCNGLTYAISPVMKALDGLRIVLNWGAKPRDLDSHLVYPENHIFFSAQQGDEANLDVDDTDSYGPETITVNAKKHGQKYIYSVHDFINKNNGDKNKQLSNLSDAKVFVYIGSTLIRTYYVPKGKLGNLWTVFYIDGDGEFHDVNKFGAAESGRAVETEILRLAKWEESNAITPDDIRESKNKNNQGEAAYHAGNFEESIHLYQESIGLDPNNAQAYSNLGLSFSKLGRNAEAIWSNRKSIALASGDTKNRVQASSYYNIGRIYESEEKFGEALQNYTWANNKMSGETYAEAIKRMQAARGTTGEQD